MKLIRTAIMSLRHYTLLFAISSVAGWRTAVQVAREARRREPPLYCMVSMGHRWSGTEKPSCTAAGGSLAVSLVRSGRLVPRRAVHRHRPALFRAQAYRLRDCLGASSAVFRTARYCDRPLAGRYLDRYEPRLVIAADNAASAHVVGAVPVFYWLRLKTTLAPSKKLAKG
jgi:hypothetical protein